MEKITADGRSLETEYTYNKNGQPVSVTYGDETQTITYDNLGRLITKSIFTEENLEYNYIYKNSSLNTENETVYQTTLLEREKMGEVQYRYTYDSVGNINSIYEKTGEDEENLLSSLAVIYSYDSDGIRTIKM